MVLRQLVDELEVQPVNDTPGIQRVMITDEVNGAGAWRFKKAKALQPAANTIYRRLFDHHLKCPLNPGYGDILCARDDIEAAYDRLLGVDVILTHTTGTQSTLQEKFLFTPFQTVTVEYQNDPDNGVVGDWFEMKPHYYFVGYDREESEEFQDWILLDWAATQRATGQGRIIWTDQVNNNDNARASFRYATTYQIPDDYSQSVERQVLVKP